MPVFTAGTTEIVVGSSPQPLAPVVVVQPDPEISASPAPTAVTTAKLLPEATGAILTLSLGPLKLPPTQPLGANTRVVLPTSTVYDSATTRKPVGHGGVTGQVIGFGLPDNNVFSEPAVALIPYI